MGINSSLPAWQTNTLPHHSKSWLVLQGSASVSYTYHYCIFPLIFGICPWISSLVYNKICLYTDVLWVTVGHLHWIPDVTKKKKILITISATRYQTQLQTRLLTLAWQASALPTSYKSRLIPQGSTSVSYTCHYCICFWVNSVDPAVWSVSTLFAILSALFKCIIKYSNGLVQNFG